MKWAHLADPFAAVDTSNPAVLRTSLHGVIHDHVRFPYTATSTGRGILLRLLLGETLELLLRDDDLILALALAAPASRGGE